LHTFSFFSLPAGLDDARDLPFKRHLTEADTADAELPEESARATARTAPIMFADGEFRRPLGFHNHC
jgi:hypothetical protein